MILRFKAFGIHLLISLLLVLGVVLWLYLNWFPGRLIHMGAWQGMAIVVLVDLVLGPVLTFVVFNPAKKSLKFDLAVIAMIQIGGLGYGLYQLESQRVVAQLLLDDRLYIIHKSDLESTPSAPAQLADRFGGLPASAFYDLPEDERAIRVRLTGIALLEGEPRLQTKYYLPMDVGGERDSLVERLQWRLDRLSYDEGAGCYWVEVSDEYYTGEACFDPATGIRQLRSG